jgi:type I restriction-modification system DNA methylase subunit
MGSNDNNKNNDKSLESWIWDAACSIRGAKEASKYKDFILPLIFVKRLCDVFDDELNRIAMNVGSRKKAFELVKLDKSLVRFYLPLKPDDPEEACWSVIRKLSDKIGPTLTTYLRDIAKENPDLSGIISRRQRQVLKSRTSSLPTMLYFVPLLRRRPALTRPQKKCSITEKPYGKASICLKGMNY